MHLQSVAGTPPVPASTSAVLYTWVASGFLYIGSAASFRSTRPHSAGPACRFLEHVTSMVRRELPDASKLRYRQARAFAPDQVGFLVARLDAEKLIRVAEQRAIDALAPPANSSVRHGDRCRFPGPPSSRARPPPSARGKRRLQLPPPCLFGGALAPMEAPKDQPGLSRWDPSQQRLPRSQDVIQWAWGLDFKAAYSTWAKMFPAESPVDIYACSQWPLMILWMSSPAASVDWSRLEHTWGPGAATTAAYVYQHLPGPLRRQRVANLVRTRLRALSLPGLARITIKVRSACQRELLASILRQLWSSLRQSLPGQRWRWSWLQSRMHIIVGTPSCGQGGAVPQQSPS